MEGVPLLERDYCIYLQCTVFVTDVYNTYTTHVYNSFLQCLTVSPEAALSI